MIADEKCRLLPLFLHSPVLFGGYSSDSEQLHGESLNYNGGMILLLDCLKQNRRRCRSRNQGN